MIERRTGMRALAALAVLAAFGVVSIGRGRGADAVDGLQHGYWWAAQPTSGGVPAPPTVPGDGLWVSSNASGPQAVSALRFSIGEGESAPILTLAVHGSAPVATGSVLACPTAAPWGPGDAQPFAKRPAPDCATVSVSGVASGDGKRMAFDLSLFPPATTYDVVLLAGTAPLPVGLQPPVAVPVTVPTVQPAPTVDVTFEPPALDAVTVLTAPVSTAPAPTSPSVSEAPATATVDRGATSPVATTPRRTTTPTTALARRRATASVPLQRVASKEDRTDRVLAALVFVALAGWAWRLSFSGGMPAMPARATIYGAAPTSSPAVPARPGAPDDGRGRPPSLR